MQQQHDKTKDLKVRIPVNYHLQLHTLKILKGKNMADALCEALDLYFAQQDQARVQALAIETMDR